jgi:radial spoke head protein 9
LIAEGSNDPLLTVSGSVQSDAKYYYSLDGVKWVDLQAVNGETASRAGTIAAILVGDPTKAYEVSEVDPNQPPKPVGEEEGGGGGEDEGPKMLVFQIPELAVLRHRLDTINSTCGVIPVVSCDMALSQLRCKEDQTLCFYISDPPALKCIPFTII